MNPQMQLMLQQAVQAFEGGNMDRAGSILKRVLQAEPKNLPALHILGLIKASQKKYEEAVELLSKAARISPNEGSIQFNLAKALVDCGFQKRSLPHHQKAVSLSPNNAGAWLNYGKAVSNLGRHEEALEYFDRAISLKPDYVEALLNKGAAFKELRSYESAISFAEQALALDPALAEGWSNKGIALKELERYEEALASYDEAIRLKPDYGDAWSNKAIVFNILNQHVEAAKCYFRALELSSGQTYLLGQAHHQMMLSCDWINFEKITHEIFLQIENDRKCAEPFGFQGIAQSEDLLRKCAVSYSKARFPEMANLAGGKKYHHEKIRIGYVCGEFREQATSILLTRIWELHDQSKFEIFAFDNGWSDGSGYRQRIEKSFSKVYDISHLADFDAAKLIAENEIDILVNLNGFFGLGRQGVFAYKPAPLQVNYLGFPGTIGATYIDYMIADELVVPPSSQEYYVEKIAYLPDSYQANDDQRRISSRKFTKSELGLPEEGFIFACFNNSYKITPTTFDLWARILKSVEGSVLWILVDNATAGDNLIKEASARGIASERLIFAGRLDLAEHLARHQLADLFLDTLPYNAHTTASDALWSGLPVLTLMGDTFPGRVSASLLTAIGLPQLITYSEDEYVALAIDLAKNPIKMQEMKVRLMKNITTEPLFNSNIFSKNIEILFSKMMARYSAGLMPETIYVKDETF